ncbi:MAG: ATP-dependent zinc metalloprotease FtsH [Caldithrix sp.]|nr:ATP-dependent zinc metalloprotease FtsH [Caldithrix sp.]
MMAKDPNNQSSKNEQKQQYNAPQRRPYGSYGFWIFIVAFIIIYYLSQNWDQETTKISYTRFKDQLQKNNIEEVTIRGQDISGQFKAPYQVITDSAENKSKSYQYFNTFKPSLEDPELLDMMESKDVTINAKAEKRPWFYTFLIYFLPWILIIGFFFYVSQRMRGQGNQMMGGGLFSMGKSKAKRYTKESTDTQYEHVAGLDNAKKDLQEIVEYLKEPSKFAALGADIPKGVLLVGPPGTGKTLLARATAGEADVPFYSISGSEFIEMFVGVGASRVRDMFENAKQEAPSIIFIDEIDSIGRARGTGLGGGHDEREQTLNQVLSEMDGFVSHQATIVIAATNRPDVLDPALTRPGRFDRQIALELPHKEAREAILKIHTKNVPLHENVKLSEIAARTAGFSGADLQNLVNEAALMAGRKDKTKVDAEDFDHARDKIILGAERENVLTDDEKETIAYHESGHALVTRLLPHTDPLQKVTIIPRGRALGVTEQIPERDRYNLKRSYLLNRIKVTLGGREAERLIFEEVSNGAANDLKQVTQIVRQMVCHWGMSDKLGPVFFKQGEQHLFLGKEMAQQKDFSEHTAKLIDEEIRRIITEAEEDTYQLLKDNRDKLDALAQALLKNETLEKEEIDRILQTKD